MMSVILITDELQRVLLDAARHLQNTNPLMRGVATQLLTQTKLNFRASGRPERWKPLSPKTIENYQRLGKSTNGLLRRSESQYLYSSIQTFSDAESAGISAGGGNQSIEYAGIHQYGGMAGRGRKVKIPARPYIPIDKDNKLHEEAGKAIADVTRAYLRRSFR